MDEKEDGRIVFLSWNSSLEIGEKLGRRIKSK
jgi:hypothetical protein